MARDPLDIDGNEAQRLSAIEERRMDVAARIEKLEAQMQTPEGRAFVWMVLEDSGVFSGIESPGIAGTSAVEHLLLLEGQRGVGRVWMHLMHTSPSLFALYTAMVEENHFAHGRNDRFARAN